SISLLLFHSSPPLLSGPPRHTLPLPLSTGLPSYLSNQRISPSPRSLLLSLYLCFSLSLSLSFYTSLSLFLTPPPLSLSIRPSLSFYAFPSLSLTPPPPPSIHFSLSLHVYVSVC